MDQTGLPFRCLVEKFQEISAAKVMEGVFIVPQTRNFFEDEQFNRILSGNWNMVWDYFRLVATNFLGNNKADNCNELVESLILSYETFMCDVSLKILFLHCHQDIFSENCLALNDKNSECFKHDISEIKRTY